MPEIGTLGLTRRELEPCPRAPDCGPERKRRSIHRRPTGGAPALDPTDERRLETEPRRGVRHRQTAKAAGNSYPLVLPPPRQSSTPLNLPRAEKPPGFRGTSANSARYRPAPPPRSRLVRPRPRPRDSVAAEPSPQLDVEGGPQSASRWARTFGSRTGRRAGGPGGAPGAGGDRRGGG